MDQKVGTACFLVDTIFVGKNIRFAKICPFVDALKRNITCCNIVPLFKQFFYNVPANIARSACNQYMHFSSSPNNLSLFVRILNEHFVIAFVQAFVHRLPQNVNSVINENEIKLLDNGSSRAIGKKQLHILTAYYIMNVHLSVLYI